jgi:hypothetical protein
VCVKVTQKGTWEKYTFTASKLVPMHTSPYNNNNNNNNNNHDDDNNDDDNNNNKATTMTVTMITTMSRM